MPNTTLNRGMFRGHVSHNFADPDVFTIKKFQYCIAGSDIELQAAAIDALCIREERWHEEELEAAAKKRLPQHPNPIENLADHANQHLIDQDENCGMTSTKFRRDRDGKKFCMPPLTRLDQQNDDGLNLVDLLVASEPQEIADWRNFVLSSEFENILNELGDGIEDVGELLVSLHGKTKNRWRQVLRAEVARIRSERDFGKNVKGGQGDLFPEKGVA